MTNLFRDLPSAPLAAESICTLLNRPGLRIERIVSAGQASPPGFWYDQPQHEWVLVLQGTAHVTVDRPEGVHTMQLNQGDCLELPARCRHRVDYTQADPPTVWLALHWPAGA